jgi:hypothetical protein
MTDNNKIIHLSKKLIKEIEEVISKNCHCHNDLTVQEFGISLSTAFSYLIADSIDKIIKDDRFTVKKNLLNDIYNSALVMIEDKEKERKNNESQIDI